MNPAALCLQPDLGAGDVHVWWIDLPRMTESDAVLSAAERDRAARFQQRHDRQRWIAAHVALRQILAHYIAIAPEALRLETGAQGKPALLNEPSLRFNLTHAGERAALAVAWQREVGIDLEPLAGDLPGRQDLPALIATVCTPAEADWIASLPLADRREAFLKVWTLKEAYLKGIGVGLMVEPRTISLSPLPLSPNELPHPQPLSHRNGRGEPDVVKGCQWLRVSTSTSPPSPSAEGEGPGLSESWTLILLNPGPEWVAALAVAGPRLALTELQWPPDAGMSRTDNPSA